MSTPAQTPTNPGNREAYLGNSYPPPPTAWFKFVGDRIINEYAGIIKKHKVALDIIPAEEFGQLTFLLFTGFISLSVWKKGLEDRIQFLNQVSAQPQ